MMHLKNDHKVDMHDGSTFNHRYVKSNPQEVENATWMLTVSLSFSLLHAQVVIYGVCNDENTSLKRTKQYNSVFTY